MKGIKFFLPAALIVILCLVCGKLCAQEQPDTLEIVPQALYVMDSTMLGTDIVQMLENSDQGIKVNQSASVAAALNGHRTLTGSRKLSGYRIRIYFSNRQSARRESAMVEEKFKENFPGVPVYRTYPNPHFKVAVGNYRTHSDALKALEEIKLVFKDAYILKEREMDFPAIK